MWQPPQVEPGQTVLFKKSPREQGHWLPAIIVGIGQSCHCVHVHVKSGRNTGVTLEHGRCYHADDPIWSDKDRSNGVMNDDQAGCWTLTPRDIRLNRMLETFEKGERQAQKPNGRIRKPAAETVA